MVCVLKYSDSDSEVEFPAAVPPVPSAVPVTGESYCSCDSQIEASCNPRLRGFTHIHDCHCGEDDQGGPLKLLLHTLSFSSSESYSLSNSLLFLPTTYKRTQKEKYLASTHCQTDDYLNVTSVE